MSELAILVPVLQRPHRVRPTLDSILKTTPKSEVLFICDPDDAEEIKAVEYAERRFGPKFVSHAIVDGNYAKKINHGVEITTTPLLLFAADDLDFHPGWLEAAKEKLTEGIGVVATNDLCNPRVERGELATHPLVTREYTKLGTVDEPDKVLHESYLHEYVDREFSETAQHRNAFASAPDAIVEHLHPLVGKAPSDELYDRVWDRMYQGRRVYNQRMHRWGMTAARASQHNAADKLWRRSR